MHILELPSFFPPYGGMFCADQSVALALKGNTVRIAANVNLSLRISPKWYFTSPVKPYMQKVRGIEVMRKNTRGIPFSLKARSMHWINNTVRLVDKYVEKYGKPDIVHAHCCKWAGYAAMLISRKYNVPYVITEHLPYAILDEEIGDRTKNSWIIDMMKEAYRAASMVIPVSEELVEDISDIVGKDYKWKYISNTIDVEFFSFRQRKKEKAGEYVVCCVGDFVKRKGYDILLPTIKTFMERYNVNLKLIIAGNNTDSDKMKNLIRSNGMEQYTEVRGKVDKYEVRDILYMSDCFVFTTRSEVQPLVLLEAMSTGLPVVSTEAIPRSERIVGGCFIGETDNVDSLVEQLHVVYTMKDFDGKAVSEAIAKLASPDAVGKLLTSLFEDVCNGFAHSE